MTESRLPTEVELAYEVMSCNAMRIAQEPLNAPHPCSYFRKWGSYHSYDYTIDGAPTERGIVHEARYVGRAPLVPELLSGCRKAPIMAVGINPNLPGWWANQRGSMNPLFDDYRQYAHYFRYRAVDKLELSDADYVAYGGGPQDTPFSDFELSVPPDDHGERRIRLQVQPQKMYQTYQSLLDALTQVDGLECSARGRRGPQLRQHGRQPLGEVDHGPRAERPDVAPDDATRNATASSPSASGPASTSCARCSRASPR